MARNDLQTRLDALEKRVASIDGTDEDRPPKRRKNPAQVYRSRKLSIAKARAAKAVGEGSGCVKSAKTKKKLEREAKAMQRELGVLDDDEG